MFIKEAVSVMGYTLEIAGVAIIILGAATAIIRLVYRQFTAGEGQPYIELRETMGRSMLIGLDFLVAGDIIRTVVVENTLDDVLGLGLVVVIRTILAFTIHLELEGHWPWQPGRSGDRERAA